MSRYVGTIRNISTLRRMLDVVVFDDGLAIVRPGLAKAVGHMVRTVLADPAPDAEAVIDREVILRDPSSRWVAWTSLSSVHLSKSWFGIFRLTVTGVDGHVERLEWKRLQNDPGTVEAILDAAVPEEIRHR